MEKIELKPCPFCGEEPQAIRIKGKDGWRDRYTVRCPYDHGGCGAEGGMYHSEAEAAWAWNQRNEWRPLTKESRPPKGGEYLVDFQGMKVGICQYINGHFRNYGEIFDGMITRWMYLPLSEKEEKEMENADGQGQVSG
jgi:Lar family restriction alleviation protein